MANELRTRDQIEARYKWDLTHIYPDETAWEADFHAVQAQIEKCSSLSGHVADDPAAAIRACFNLNQHFAKVYCYAMLRFESDNNDSAAQSMSNRCMSLAVQASTATSYLNPELLELPDDRLDALYHDPALAEFSEMLRKLIRQKAHELPKDQARLLAMTGDLSQTPENVFSMLTGTDMHFQDIVDDKGEHFSLSEGNYGGYVDSSDRTVRRQALHHILEGYAKLGNTFAAIYGGSVKSDNFYARATNYDSARQAALDPNEIPQTVYDNLITVIHESIPVLTEYLQLRKKVLKLDELHMYDLYCPMVADYDMKLPYEQAYDLVLQGLQPMGDDYIQVLKEARTGGWIDVYPCQDKSGGAFSLGELADVHPYVKLNHNDNLDSAFTIAHELGHAMHSYFSNHAQPAPKADYSLFVAEVASICNEAVMLRFLLDRASDTKERAYLLNHFLEQFRTTCFRQTLFAEFEKLSHEMEASGEPLTRDSLNEAYLNLCKTYYGDGCIVDDIMANEWMRIPHFYSAFYVYVYATGLCAAVTLSAGILSGDPEALKNYRRFLSAGCSVSPIEALKLAGIDMSTPDPIRKAMDVFRSTLDEFKQCF